MEEAYEKLGMGKEELETHLYHIRAANLKRTLKLNIEKISPIEKNMIDSSGTQEFRILSWEIYSPEVDKKNCEFILKKYSDESKFKEEKNLLVDTQNNIGSSPYVFTENRAIGIFPKPLSHNYTEFNSKNLLLMDSIPSATLEKRMEDAERESVYWGEIKSALDPVVLLHDLLPHRREEIKYNAGKISHRKHIRNSLRGVVIMKNYFMLNDRDKITLQEELLNIDEYLNQTENATIIQKEGYPWHNMFRSLVSANIGVGHRALHLGYLFGHPSVYNKLKNVDEAIKNLCEEYQWRREKLAEQENFALDRRIETANLEKVFYIGAIIGNLNAAVKLHRKGSEEQRNKAAMALKELAQTISVQLYLLNQKGIGLGRGIKILNRNI